MTDTIILGGGCFWCIEAAFYQLRGVESVVSGYAGGAMANPTYEAVCSGESGHAEVVHITYDSSVISLSDLLSVFVAIHDPTTVNRQGNDIGEQYRSVIFYTSPEQEKEIRLFIVGLEQNHLFDKPVVTEVLPAPIFYPAEEYHQRYYEKNPNQGYCSVMISPKLKKLREKFGELVKKAG